MHAWMLWDTRLWAKCINMYAWMLAHPPPTKTHQLYTHQDMISVDLFPGTITIWGFFFLGGGCWGVRVYIVFLETTSLINLQCLRRFNNKSTSRWSKYWPHGYDSLFFHRRIFILIWPNVFLCYSLVFFSVFPSSGLLMTGAEML